MRVSRPRGFEQSIKQPVAAFLEAFVPGLPADGGILADRIHHGISAIHPLLDAFRGTGGEKETEKAGHQQQREGLV